MNAPMADFGPMAWSPFPYGPVPSSGVISPFYVDLFNAQTVAGAKTWQVDAVTGAETVAVWKVSDDAVALMDIFNGSTGAGRFAPVLRWASSSTNTGGFALFQIESDSGANPAGLFRARVGANTAVATRPLFSFQNNATEVASVSAKGDWTYTVQSSVGATDLMGTWAVSGLSGGIIFNNSTSSDTDVVPEVRLTANSNNPNYVIFQGATDLGSTAVGRFRARIGSSTAIATRPVFDWSNQTVALMSITAAGSLTLQFPLTHRSYTVATLPSAAIAGQEVYVSDAAVAPCLAFTNGANWKRCDNAATTVV